AGFRMGPCELMDLIGHDTNFAVTQSVFEANFGDKRYQPSLVQREMVDGGLLGRKSGRGFFSYGPVGSAAPAATGTFESPPVAPAGGAPGTPLALSFAASASAAWREQAAEWLRIAGWQPQAIGDSPGLVVARTIAMLVNEAADAVQQGVCTPEGADLAMKLGV